MDELIKRLHEMRPDLIGPNGEVLRLPDLNPLINMKGHAGPCGPKFHPEEDSDVRPT